MTGAHDIPPRNQRRDEQRDHSPDEPVDRALKHPTLGVRQHGDEHRLHGGRHRERRRRRHEPRDDQRERENQRELPHPAPDREHNQRRHDNSDEDAHDRLEHPSRARVARQPQRADRHCDGNDRQLVVEHLAGERIRDDDARDDLGDGGQGAGEPAQRAPCIQLPANAAFEPAKRIGAAHGRALARPSGSSRRGAEYGARRRPGRPRAAR